MILLIFSYQLSLILIGLQNTVATMGYGPEDKNTVLELTYIYGITNYDKGNGYGQVDTIYFPFSKVVLLIFVLFSVSIFYILLLECNSFMCLHILQ